MEIRCDTIVTDFGWLRVADEWDSVYVHPSLGAVLVIYVDDFKMAARAEHHDQL